MSCATADTGAVLECDAAVWCVLCSCTVVVVSGGFTSVWLLCGDCAPNSMA